MSDQRSDKTKKDLTAWEMSHAILTAIHETIKVAEGELAAALEAGNQSPFAPGTSLPRHIAEAMREAERNLTPELHKIARSNNLTMPEQPK